MIHIITGDGKGKTTAALGLVLRAVGAGFKVAIIFFDKGGEGHYSERKALRERFSDSVMFQSFGRDRIDPQTGRFDFTIVDEDREQAERALALARDALSSGVYSLVVLDEIISTVGTLMLSEKNVLDVLAQKNPSTEVVLTGRNAPESFMDLADLVSEVKMIKHYYYSGVKAREGIDY